MVFAVGFGVAAQFGGVAGGAQVDDVAVVEGHAQAVGGVEVCERGGGGEEGVDRRGAAGDELLQSAPGWPRGDILQAVAGGKALRQLGQQLRDGFSLARMLKPSRASCTITGSRVGSGESMWSLSMRTGVAVRKPPLAS